MVPLRNPVVDSPFSIEGPLLPLGAETLLLEILVVARLDPIGLRFLIAQFGRRVLHMAKRCLHLPGIGGEILANKREQDPPCFLRHPTVVVPLAQCPRPRLVTPPLQLLPGEPTHRL